MGSLTPPWADELLAQNTKIARKMMSSLSTESYFEDPFEVQRSPSPVRRRPNRFKSVDSDSSSPNGHGDSKVVDPGRMANSQSPTSTSSPTSSPPSGGSKAKPRRQHSRNTEKLSAIRNDSYVEDEGGKKGFEMTNGEDLSILEYGPGIVKKLRSRYQSLALRQFTSRPTLRRSASLENVLDAVSAEELAATLESKISNHDNQQEDERNEINGRQHRGRNRFASPVQDSRTSSPAAATTVAEQREQQPQEQSGKHSVGATPRGRSSGLDATARRDRMRRARSVDALHRTKREEEILEKFKHVVLPKEDIVIIEVSKPQEGSVLSSAAAFNQVDGGSNGTSGEKRFPTRLLLTSNNFKNSAILDQQGRNLMISPEHELPPHDIVRETARIFERNQENLNRRIGQALRLSKSQSVTGVGVGSPPLEPASPTPSEKSNNSLQQKPVMAQSPTSSSGPMQPSQDKVFPTKTSNKEPNTAMANGPSHGQKQIGIIKPTLNNSNGVINGKISNGVGSASAGGESRVRSPILSPIGFVSNKPLIQHTHKPPLSPKPIFTSSPKVNGPVGGLAGTREKNGSKDSPSSSPILIIDNRERSLSPFKSESPIPRVGGDVNRIKSPPRNSDTPPDSLEEKNGFARTPSPVNGKFSPVNGENKRLENGKGNPGNPNPTLKSKPVEEKDKVEKIVLKPVPPQTNGSTLVGSSDHHRQQVTRDIPPPPPRSVSPQIAPPAQEKESSNNPNSKNVSQLRVHQKKTNQGGNGSMVFNFTTRKDVPNYIEDDGLRKSGRMETVEEGSNDKDIVDNRIILFEGGNVIINGKSSIQKRPKSQKMNISFNESATTTHEYPSESSLLIDDDPSEDQSPKKPSVTGSTSLGSYTPKAGSNAYQLGSYSQFDTSPGLNVKKANGKDDGELIEDYLKPNQESTTWSNEMSADILF